MDWIPAKTILSGYSENNLWFGTNYNMNLYKGCSHGCIYCDSRSDCYGVEIFDKVRAKENALSILERELRCKRKRGVVGTGAMSDPYNPFEKEYQLTRGALVQINRYGYGVAIATKSNVALSSQRFATIKTLSQAGIFAGILCMPILPFIEDNENNIRAIVEQAHENGAKFIYPAFGVTLRQNQREWYYDKLDELFPSLKEKYMITYGNSYECKSPKGKELWRIFVKTCQRHGILYKMDEIIKGYKSYGQPVQLSWF